jgi:hypothetical protein
MSDTLKKWLMWATLALVFAMAYSGRHDTAARYDDGCPQWGAALNGC